MNYSVGQKIYANKIPYNLTNQYMEFDNKQHKAVRAKDVIDYTQYKNLIVIAELRQSQTAGLLDLPMSYYSKATKLTAPREYRYFSKDDYRQQKKVGIGINSCDSSNIASVKSSKERYQLDEVINCFHTDVWDYGGINVIQNIYSIDFQEVTKLFVDSTERTELKVVKAKLQAAGFDLITKNNKISLFQAMKDSIIGRKQEQFLVSANITVLLLYIVMSFFYSHKYDRILQISRIVGGETKQMLPVVILPTIIISIIILCCAYLLIFYFEYINANYLSLLNFIKIQLFMLVCNVLIVTANLFINFKNAENLAR